MLTKLTLTLTLTLLAMISQAAEPSADVVVYGGTSGGVVAAVEAARHGKKVVLIEPTKRLGGMSSGGLGMTDNGSTSTIGGLSLEFYQRVYQFYLKPENWRFQKREDYLAWMPKIWGVDGPRMEEIKAAFLFEPRAAKAVFDDMVKEAGIKVVLGERLDLKKGVVKDGPKIVKIVMESGREFAGKVFIDSSYEGDVMAKAGVSYIVGREPNSKYGETLNGSFPFTPEPSPKVSPYVVAGDPSSGLLPRVEPKPPAPKGSGDHRVQGYNFRLCLTPIAENRVPIEKPANYNPLEYELLARYIATLDKVRPGPGKHAAIALRGTHRDLAISFHTVPNHKTDSNNGGSFGSDVYGLSYEWPDGDHAKRDQLFQLHKDYTLGLLWFLGNDERVPEAVRTEMRRWGLAKDEFTETGHFPHQLYVREARRMISDYVITEHDAKSGPRAEDGIALASYPLDSHSVTLYVDENGVLHRERGFYVGGVTPFPISYRSMRPKPGECENLLVVSCLSASHAAYGSVRMEPVFMMVGHAAGAAASLAIEKGVSVQNVPYAALREVLLKEKQILESPQPIAKSPAPPPQEQTAADMKKLVALHIVTADADWLPNAGKSQNCDGSQVRDLLQKMAAHLDASATTFDQALVTLQKQNIISSPTYWTQNATEGRKCGGDFVSAVIRKFVRVATPKK